MSLTLYGFERSPPCQAVLLTIRALGLEVEFKNVDLTTGEQKTKNFKRINPAGKVPVLEDNGFYILESYAINSYLVNQYGKDDKLYPKDARKRSVVDTMMYFDASSLDNNIREFFAPQIFLHKPANPERKAIVEEKLAILNTILGQRPYVAADHATIADFSIISSLSVLLVTKFNFDAYPDITNWIKRVKADVSFYDEVTAKGLDALRLMVQERLGT